MKTALILTGGTIGSAVKDGYISPVRDGSFGFADCDIYEPFRILSENLNGGHILALLKCIEERLKDYDGIIVTHGTDTLQYSAAAASYAFGADSAPIVFVSSNYVLSDPRANGRDNFKYAEEFINNRRGWGVFISYKNAGENPKIHRASRVLPYAPYSDRLESLGGEYGYYENGEFVKNKEYSERKDEAKPFGVVDFREKSVIRIGASPDMPAEFLNSADAVLLETYHSGTVSEEVVKGLNTDVFILGMEQRIQYESTKAYEKANVTVLEKAAPPAMYIKLKMALAAGRICDINKSIGADI